jgi:SAM-dependent methyltransferase
MLQYLQPILRFASRAENYARYRPSYPMSIIDIMEQEWHFHAGSVVVDIGSGTGIFSQMLLDNDNTVYGVEPNAEMRTFAEQWLQSYVTFHSIAEQGENTMLPAGLCDVITCAQSFHWLDKEKAREEFRRILKPDGFVVLVWNLPERESAFGQDYEAFLQVYGTDYAQISTDAWTEQSMIERVLEPGSLRRYEFPNQQYFDFEGLQGRVLSNSFIPQQGDVRYDAMLAELRALYDRHAHKDMIVFRYQTLMYCGRLLGE